MKAKSLFVCAFAISLASCTSEAPDSGVKVSQDSQARFSGSVEGQFTRAYDATWELSGHDGPDKIGITCNTAGTDYINVAYKLTDATGKFAVNTTGQEIYYQNDDEVTFTAYYPWKDALNGTVTVNEFSTAGQKNNKSFDWLWAQAKGKKAAPNVNFSFKHLMSKVVITVKKGLDVSWEELEAFKFALSEYMVNGSFDRVAGTVSAASSSLIRMPNVQVYRNNEEAAAADDATFQEVIDQANGKITNTLILLPQEFGGSVNANKLTFQAEKVGSAGQKFIAEIDLTNANKKFETGVGEVPAAKNALVGGRQYNITVTLNKTDIEVSGTVQNWNDADDTDDIEAV